MADVVEKELAREFGAAMDDRELLHACTDICRVFNLSPESLRYKWEAMTLSFTGPSVTVLDLDGVRQLRARVKRELDDRVEAAAKAKARLAKPAGSAGTRSGRLFAGPKFSTSASSSAKSTTVTQTDKIIRNAGANNAFNTIFVGSDARHAKAYRYMYEKLSERALDTRIDKLADLIRNHYKLSDLADPSDPSETEVVVVGRVVGDSDAKLNEASLMIESSRMMGSGYRTPLKFDPQFRLQSGSSVNLFPGMVLAARGKNGGGGWFSITDVIDERQLPFPQQRSIDAGSVDPFTVVIVSGPYTPDTDKELQYRGFYTLLARIKQAPPSVLVLLGPFLDSSHPALQDGAIPQDPQNIFATRFGRPLQAFCQHCPATRVVLVSSVKDILNSHFVFPQGPMEPEGLGLPQNVTILPNPSSFTVNGVRFGVSTVDVLFHMRREGFSKKSSTNPQHHEPPDPMLEFCKQLILQRSFYPVFPVPKEYMHETNLDVSHHDLLDFASFFEEPDAVPDILVLPSVLKHFQKVIEHINVVNPPSYLKGQLVAKISCQPRPNVSLASSVSVTFDHLDS